MKKISLTKGKFAIVDDQDFEWLNQWKWTYDGLYARRNISLGYKDGRYKVRKVYMHRIINNTPKGLITDHINRNTLDNRRKNLRTVSKSDNLYNTGIWNHNKSGYKGVSWSKSARKWLARIQINKKTFHLGLHNDLQAAVLARKQGEDILL